MAELQESPDSPTTPDANADAPVPVPYGLSRWTRGAWVVLGVVVILAVALWIGMPWLRHQARKSWKEAAIPRISRLADDPTWVAAEIQKLRPGASPVVRPDPMDMDIGWLSDNMILMDNGEWLVYQNHCSKAAPRIVSDICLAKGSDGVWYYTTCHFCVDMVGLMMSVSSIGRPPTLAAFVEEFQMRPFDGVSDLCLEPTATWPKYMNDPNQRGYLGSQADTPSASSSPASAPTEDF